MEKLRFFKHKKLPFVRIQGTLLSYLPICMHIYIYIRIRMFSMAKEKTQQELVCPKLCGKCTPNLQNKKEHYESIASGIQRAPHT